MSRVHESNGATRLKIAISPCEFGNFADKVEVRGGTLRFRVNVNQRNVVPQRDVFLATRDALLLHRVDAKVGRVFITLPYGQQVGR